MYRCLIDGLFGVQGSKEGLQIKPQLPSDWNEATVRRIFRGAELHIDIKREPGATTTEVYVNGNYIEDGIIKDLKADTVYAVLVKIPS